MIEERLNQKKDEESIEERDDVIVKTLKEATQKHCSKGNLRTKCSMTCNYYYLDISLKLAEYQEITPALFKNHVIFSINQLFGEVSASIPFDLLKYNSSENRAILRVPKDHYVKVRSSLTLSGFYQGIRFPSTVKLPEADTQPGLILPNGDINWNCPCLGGMATGPCGVEFRNAFSCFHYSKEDPKGSDCFNLFKTMQTCMQQYPTLYNKDLGGLEEEDEDAPIEVPEIPTDPANKDKKC
ncbi:hypothetical protein RN001_000353 [Aquatica leii]|uniref:CHCH domain-containing protein n=1 Tax=Aquatica leii TaxID=1421715 RepID=A0AAN7PER8_9COLE|nr:hypothetical protein RN001_000353 [Aquatica leii]